jgi:hypothetical protein
MQSASQPREFTASAAQTAPVSKKTVWAGRTISTLAVLFLVFDGVGKVMKESHVMEGSARLGYPAGLTVGTGILLLACTVIYVIPGTAVFGAILLTGYLGGATAVQLGVGTPLFETLFPVIFGVLIWAGLFLRDDRLRKLLPLRS